MLFPARHLFFGGGGAGSPQRSNGSPAASIETAAELSKDFPVIDELFSQISTTAFANASQEGACKKKKKKGDRRHVIVRDWFCARRLNRFLKEEFDKMAARLQWERLPSGTWKDKLIPRQTVGGTHFFSDFFLVFFFV